MRGRQWFSSPFKRFGFFRNFALQGRDNQLVIFQPDAFQLAGARVITQAFDAEIELLPHLAQIEIEIAGHAEVESIGRLLFLECRLWHQMIGEGAERPASLD